MIYARLPWPTLAAVVGCIALGNRVGAWGHVLPLSFRPDAGLPGARSRRPDSAIGTPLAWTGANAVWLYLNCSPRTMPGVRPGGRPTSLVSPRDVGKRRRPCRMALRVRSVLKFAGPRPTHCAPWGRYVQTKGTKSDFEVAARRPANSPLSPLQKGLNSKEHGSLRVALKGARCAQHPVRGAAQRAVTLRPV